MMNRSKREFCTGSPLFWWVEMRILITKAEELIQMNGINLKELVGQFDCLMEEWSYFINKATYEIISIEDRYLGYTGEPGGNP